MTDQSAYVNAYLENTVAMLHDQLNQIIQLKTQVKLSENLLSQKDSTIAELSNKLSVSVATEKEFDTLKEEAIHMSFSSVASAPMVRSSYHADLQAHEAQN